MVEIPEAVELRKLYAGVIELTVPLPPTSLRSNSRSHWGQKVRDKVVYSRDVYAEWMCRADRYRHALVEKATVLYVWCHAGTTPDVANLGANLKALQDFLCMAPNTGKQRNDCYYLGIIGDDRNIRPLYRALKVEHRRDECVRVLIAPEKLAEDEHALCKDEWHRCADDGGPGEYERYVKGAADDGAVEAL